MARADRTSPPTPLTYQILLALADADRHGYGIIKEIEERAAAAAPSTGALYLALQRMEGNGLIADAPAPAPPRPPWTNWGRRWSPRPASKSSNMFPKAPSMD